MILSASLSSQTKSIKVVVFTRRFKATAPVYLFRHSCETEEDANNKPSRLCWDYNKARFVVS